MAEPVPPWSPWHSGSVLVCSGQNPPVAWQRWDRRTRSAIKPPCCWPASPFATRGDGAGRLQQLWGAAPHPLPCQSRVGFSTGLALGLLQPQEHRGGRWHSVQGKVPPSLQTVKGWKGQESVACVLLNDASLSGRSSGVAGQVPGAALGKSQRALPGAASVQDAPETSQAPYP